MIMDQLQLKIGQDGMEMTGSYLHQQRMKICNEDIG